MHICACGANLERIARLVERARSQRVKTNHLEGDRCLLVWVDTLPPPFGCAVWIRPPRSPAVFGEYTRAKEERLTHALQAVAVDPPPAQRVAQNGMSIAFGTHGVVAHGAGAVPLLTGEQDVDLYLIDVLEGWEAGRDG
jgi:hypothetical protein